MELSIILTGASGMVGEGVLLEALKHPAVSRVLVVGRRPCGHSHPKLKEVLVPNFTSLDAIEGDLRGYNTCLFCAGVSSLGKKEAEYSHLTYEVALSFCTVVARLNPGITLEYISGAGTDSSGEGTTMWARVKGRTENSLARLPGVRYFSIRPGLMRSTPGQKNIPWFYKGMNLLYLPMRLVLPRMVSTLSQVGRAMLEVALNGYSKQTLEVPDLNALAKP